MIEADPALAEFLDAVRECLGLAPLHRRRRRTSVESATDAATSRAGHHGVLGGYDNDGNRWRRRSPGAD